MSAGGGHRPEAERRGAFDRLARGAALAAVVFYQRMVSPVLRAVAGDCCRFYPSCSEYARQAFERKPFWTACRLSAWRLLRCQPLCKGGFDPLDPEDGETAPTGADREDDSR